MRSYIGTKRIEAEPEADRLDEGYKVVYPDGYESWSPKATFEEAYQPVTAMSFSGALHVVRNGGRACRADWMAPSFIFLVPGSRFTVDREPLLAILGAGTEVDYHGHIDIKLADGQIATWVATQDDLLADDWMLVD